MTDAELDAIRARMNAGPTTLTRSGAEAVADRAALLAEVDRLRRLESADPKLLADARDNANYLSKCQNLGQTEKHLIVALDHIDSLEGVLHDMQTDAGAGLAYAQGAAEERAAMGQIFDRWLDNASLEALHESLRFLKRDILEPKTELLPPAAVRLALEQERRKVAVLREAMERIAEDQPISVGVAIKRRLAEVARATLEKTA